MRIFIPTGGDAGALYFFDVPSIMIGFFAGVLIVELIFVIVYLWRRRK